MPEKFKLIRNYLLFAALLTILPSLLLVPEFNKYEVKFINKETVSNQKLFKADFNSPMFLFSSFKP